MDKNIKKIIINDEENILEDLNNENNEYEKQIEDEYEKLEYFENTIDIIHKELIYYIENKSITVGEYLKKDKLNMFLSL